MDSGRIKQIRDSKKKAAQRKYENFQYSGVNKYYTEYQHYSDLVDICNMALSISEIKAENVRMKLVFNDLVESAHKLLKYKDYYEPEEAKKFIEAFMMECKRNGFGTNL